MSSAAASEPNTNGSRSPSRVDAPWEVSVGGQTYEWRQVAFVGLLAAGAVSLILAWIGISATDQVWKQMPYLISGGVGGIGLVLSGVAFYTAYQHEKDRREMEELRRHLEALELGLAGEFDDVSKRLDALNSLIENLTRPDPARSRK